MPATNCRALIEYDLLPQYSCIANASKGNIPTGTGTDGEPEPVGTGTGAGTRNYDTVYAYAEGKSHEYTVGRAERNGAARRPWRLV